MPKIKKSLKIVIFTCLGIIVLAGLGYYLNRSYSYIYQVIGDAKLSPVEDQGTYLINNPSHMATSTLFYVALGDSLTAGVGTESYTEILPYRLAEKLTGADRQVELSNFSVSGITTVDLVNYLVPKAIKAQPEAITILIGVNDIHNMVLADEFAKNYEEMLSRLTKETKAQIYVISIPFIGSDKLMSPFYQTLFGTRTQQFNAIIKKLADKYQVKYINLYGPTVKLFKSSGSHYSADLFHPSAAGYQLWADIIYDHLN